MWKTIGTLALLATGLSQTRPFQRLKPTLELKEEGMTLEYTPSRNEMVVVVEAEGESSLGRIEVRGPDGGIVLCVDSNDYALQGFVVEARESDPETLFRTYQEGVYELQARTVDGQLAVGSARLVHALLPAPRLLYPVEGAVHVSTTPVLSWVPDPNASAYVVILEQDENDGLQVTLPGESSRFEVPYGVLRPGAETFAELAVVGPNGNRTLTEIRFRTQ